MSSTNQHNLFKDLKHIENKIFRGEATSVDIDYILQIKEIIKGREQFCNYLIGLAYYFGVGRTKSETNGEKYFKLVKESEDYIDIFNVAHAYSKLDDDHFSDRCLECLRIASGKLKERAIEEFIYWNLTCLPKG